MERTGEPFLDEAMQEFKRLGNIDIFNNAVAWAFDAGTWREMMRNKGDMMAKGQLPPDVICDDLYAKSPLAAVVHKLAVERAQGSAESGKQTE